MIFFILSGLFLAISRKDKNVVTSILNALPKLAATHHLDNEQVYKFLSAKNRTPSHVLYHVMANGDADMLKIVLNALPLLIRTFLWLPRTISGDAKWT